MNKGDTVLDFLQKHSVGGGFKSTRLTSKEIKTMIFIEKDVNVSLQYIRNIARQNRIIISRVSVKVKEQSKALKVNVFYKAMSGIENKKRITMTAKHFGISERSVYRHLQNIRRKGLE